MITMICDYHGHIIYHNPPNTLMTKHNKVAYVSCSFPIVYNPHSHALKNLNPHCTFGFPLHTTLCSDAQEQWVPKCNMKLAMFCNQSLLSKIAKLSCKFCRVHFAKLPSPHPLQVFFWVDLITFLNTHSHL